MTQMSRNPAPRGLNRPSKATLAVAFVLLAGCSLIVITETDRQLAATQRDAAKTIHERGCEPGSYLSEIVSDDTAYFAERTGEPVVLPPINTTDPGEDDAKKNAALLKKAREEGEARERRWGWAMGLLTGGGTLAGGTGGWLVLKKLFGKKGKGLVKRLVATIVDLTDEVEPHMQHGEEKTPAKLTRQIAAKHGVDVPVFEGYREKREEAKNGKG